MRKRTFGEYLQMVGFMGVVMGAWLLLFESVIVSFILFLIGYLFYVIAD